MYIVTGYNQYEVDQMYGDVWPYGYNDPQHAVRAIEDYVKNIVPKIWDKKGKEVVLGELRKFGDEYRISLYATKKDYEADEAWWVYAIREMEIDSLFQEI